MLNLSASLVLFHNEPADYNRAISSFLNGSDGILYVIDNSKQPLKSDLFQHPRVNYIFTGKNLGFGKGHNKAIELVGNKSDVHLIINPDIYFDINVLPEILIFLKENPNVGALMPQVLYPDKRIQHLCKLIPTPVDLICRRFFPLIAELIINPHYELRDLPQDRPSVVPVVSGCFLLVRTKLFHQIGGFDEHFFMYMEDVDLSRRIGEISDVVYFPLVKVTHVHARGSYKKIKMLRHHIISAMRYFNKWGWIYDKKRQKINQRYYHLKVESLKTD